jgi:hypothetical protein
MQNANVESVLVVVKVTTTVAPTPPAIPTAEPSEPPPPPEAPTSVAVTFEPIGMFAEKFTLLGTFEYVHLIGFVPDGTPFVPLTEGHAAVVVSEAFAKFSRIFGKATGIA